MVYLVPVSELPSRTFENVTQKRTRIRIFLEQPHCPAGGDPGTGATPELQGEYELVEEQARNLAAMRRSLVRLLRFSPEGRHLAVVYVNGMSYLLRLRSGNAVSRAS